MALWSAVGRMGSKTGCKVVGIPVCLKWASRRRPPGWAGYQPDPDNPPGPDDPWGGWRGGGPGGCAAAAA